MTSLFRSRALRAHARVLSLICSQFIALTLVRLAQWRRASRHRLRPARSRHACSGFRRFACLVMVVVMVVQVPASPQVSQAAAKVVSATAINSWQGAYFWWHSSGWAARAERLRNEYLPTIGAQPQRRGWDGKGAPRRSRPAPQAVETQQDREQRIARVRIFPGDVEIKTGEQVVFNAIAFDQDGNAINGLEAKWSALHEERNHPLTITSHGAFVSGAPGKFIVMAEIAGRKERVKVRVTGEARRPGVRSRSETPKSSRESRRVSSLRAPISGDQKRIARRSKQARWAALPGAALPGSLRAASAPMSARPAMIIVGEDETGWNSTNNDTIDDVGSERGHVPGRAIDGGAGSSNFQFAAPAAVLDGRGIDLAMLLSYNSRLWHKAGSEITFDIDRDWIPGWNLGFGKIVMAGDTYMLIDGDGTRHPYQGTLRGNFSPPMSALQTFEAHTTDGTFIDYYAEGFKPQFDNSGGRNMVTAWAVMPNGTRIEYSAQANYAIYPVRITDAHGNFINITYRNNEGPQIETITDTLGRVIQFYYDGSGLLTAIVVPGFNGGSREAVRLQYQSMTLSLAGDNFGFAGGLTTKVRQDTIPVIRAIYYPGTSTGYWFGDDGDSYSPYGMIRKVSERRNMTFDNAPLDQQGNIGAGTMTREMVYNYPQFGGNFSDMPTYTQMTEDWVGRGAGEAPETQFSVVDSGGTRTTTITRPDGAQLEQITDNNQSSPTHGMLLEDAFYQDSSHSVVLSRSKAFWEIGAYNSPRPWRTESTDEREQTTATTFSYDPASGSIYNSVTDARALGYSGELLRRTHTKYLNNGDYNGFLQNSGTLWLKQGGGLSAGPIWRGSHIFNLVDVTEVYGPDDVTRLSRTEYQYDVPGLINNPGMIQHNSWYNPHTPDLEVCEQIPDETDVDCTGCPPPPMDCPSGDGVCNYITVCNYYPQYDPATAYRGNVTQIKSYADAVSLDQGTAVVETRTYDVAGNLRVQSSSCCEQTTITCTTNTQYAWAESLTSGSPSDSPPETSKQNTSSATYDYNTGLVNTATDANGRVSQIVYDPNTLRPTQEFFPTREFPPTGAYQFHIYDDLNLSVSDFVYEAGQSGANFASRSDKHLDGLGRVIKEVAFGKDYVLDVVETKFDNLGRVSQQSRPYRFGVETPQWSAVTYDSLDRPVQTIAPDTPNNSVVTRSYNQPDPPGSSGQPGQTIKVSDPWGPERWARSDALGHMVEVAEPDPGGNGTLSSGALFTTYAYDALGRLVEVNQGAQTRSFRYDSLGRLTHQKLAERDATLDDGGNWVGAGQWSDVFTYDKRSNLTRHVDARGVKTIFKYEDAGGVEDPLNRLLEVEYDKSGSPPHLRDNIPDAPKVNYDYMTTTPGNKMRAASVVVSNGMGNEQLSYDSEGRLAQVSQTFAGRESYPMLSNYIWDSLDRLKESLYPQQYGAGDIRKKVEPAYDIASRMDSVKFGGATYASNPVYNAASQTMSLAVGSEITEKYDFDPKTGLLFGQQVNKGAEKLVDLQYRYTLDVDWNNNGAKTGQLTYVRDVKNEARNRNYVYDKLGRLKQVRGGTLAYGSPAWYQSHTYDRYGNRSLVQHTELAMAPVNPGSQSRSDLIGKTGPEAGAAANRIFSAGEPFAALGINEGYGSIAANSSDSDNTGTPRRGGPRVSAEEYSNAPSANVVGGKSLAKHPAGAAPSAPRKEYGRSGRSIVTVTPQSVSSISPTANQSPDPGQGGNAVTSPSNTGHGSTNIWGSESKTSLWHSFPPVSGVTTKITLKFDWSITGNVSASTYWAEDYAEAIANLNINYSLNNGATWTSAVSSGGSVWCPNIGVCNESWPVNDGGSASISIPASTPINQIRVQDKLFGQAIASGWGAGVTSDFSVTISSIRLEVERDTTPPVISNVAAGGITSSRATITWNTNEGSDSQVDYGTTPAYGQWTPLNSDWGTTHSKGLTGLTAGTVYHYRVKSRDASGNLAISGDYSFTTVPVIIPNVVAEGITSFCVTITWNTNVPTNSQVEYGTTTAYGQFEPDTPNTALVTSHSQYIPGLTPGTVYHYRVWSRDEAGNLAISPDFSFTTGLLAITSVAAVNITTSSATINWTTSKPTDSQVAYGTTPAYGQFEPTTPSTELATEHSVALTGLTAGTLYYYTIKSRDAGGNLAYCGGLTFTTAQSVPTDGLASLSYNDANNRITTPGFEYDPDGNQTRAVIDASGTQQQYRYDCAGRLVQVLDASGNVLATHAYGASNQRLMSVEGGVTKYFAWAGGQIIAEYEASGANALVWKTSYVYLGGRLLATTSGTDETETRFHHPDRLGTRLVTATDGTVVSEQWTMPFGNMQPFTSVPGGENPYRNPTLSNPSKKRFTSYDRSEATGLDYAVNRFYSPQQGRFTQVDPIGMSAASLGNPQTLNLYAYCGNDPINHVDPDGLFFKKLFGWIGKIFKWVAIVAIVVMAVLTIAPGAWAGTVMAKIGIWSIKHPILSALIGLKSPQWAILNLAKSAGGAAAAGFWAMAGVGAVSDFAAKKKKKKKPDPYNPDTVVTHIVDALGHILNRANSHLNEIIERENKSGLDDRIIKWVRLHFHDGQLLKKMAFSEISDQKAAPSCLDIDAIKISTHGGGPLQCQLALSPRI